MLSASSTRLGPTRRAACLGASSSHPLLVHGRRRMGRAHGVLPPCGAQLPLAPLLLGAQPAGSRAALPQLLRGRPESSSSSRRGCRTAAAAASDGGEAEPSSTAAGASAQPPPTDAAGPSEPGDTTVPPATEPSASSGGLGSSDWAQLGKINIDGLRERSKELQDKLRSVVPKLEPKLFYGSMTFKQVLTAIGYRTVFMFLVFGGFLPWALTAWVRGSDLKMHDPYKFTVTFPLAPSLAPGVALKLRGVQIGAVREARSGLALVEATVEVNTRGTRMPRESRLVYNKAGPLSPTPFIDVQIPEPDELAQEALVETAAVPSAAAAASAARAGPDEVDACRAEGVLVCGGDHLTGQQGGGMDELTALTLKSVRRGVDDPSVLPPVMREIHLREAAAAAAAAAAKM